MINGGTVSKDTKTLDEDSDPMPRSALAALNRFVC